MRKRATNETTGRRVAVLGSLNVDLLWQVSQLPRAGMTVLAEGILEDYGGKGANQAVAAARQGGHVTMLGAVGDDDRGRNYRTHLVNEGVRFVSLSNAPDGTTGAANIYVDAHGENMIVVHAGANAQLCPIAAESALQEVLRAHDLLVMQLETPLSVVLSGLDIAKRVGAISILNAAPYCAELRWGRYNVDIVVVNEHECRDFFGRVPELLLSLSPSQVAAFFPPLGINNLIVTRGALPTLWVGAHGSTLVPIHPVTPVDTVGAGDTFVGALAAALATGLDMPAAIRRANTAAALSTLARGAQSAMPRLAQVLACEILVQSPDLTLTPTPSSLS